MDTYDVPHDPSRLFSAEARKTRYQAAGCKASIVTEKETDSLIEEKTITIRAWIIRTPEPIP